MRKQRGIYLSSTVLSVLLHLLSFSAVAISLETCTGPVSVATQASPPHPPMETIEAETITQQEVNAYYERKQQEALKKERALQLEKEQQERARQLAEERKRAELLRQKKLQEEEKRLEEVRLEQLRVEKQKKEQQRLAEEKKRLEEEQRRKAEEEKRLAEERKRKAEEEKRLAEEQKRKAEEEKRLAEERKRKAEEEKRLAEEQKRIAEEKKRLEEEKKKQLEEERRRLAEHREREEAERLKMRKKQIAIWQRQYEQMIRNSVEQHWKKPPASVAGGECVLKLRQNEEGAILDVKFVRCEGDKLFIRSVEAAVWKANPLPTPPSADVFDSEIEFTFKRDY